jgi:hypothetical protein
LFYVIVAIIFLGFLSIAFFIAKAWVEMILAFLITILKPFYYIIKYALKLIAWVFKLLFKVVLWVVKLPIKFIKLFMVKPKSRKNVVVKQENEYHEGFIR